jgi:hypothetical protein
MKLELSVSKKPMNRASGFTEELVFAVVDLDKADSYPRNFVCLLPKNLQREGNPASKFPIIYGKESNRIAIELLTKALRSQGDLGVRAEIEKRLKALQPKPTAKCAICGCTFEPMKFGHFLQKVCKTCRYKGKSQHLC